MANLKIGGAYNEAGEKFFASNSLTVKNFSLYWNDHIVFHEGNFSISNDFTGNATPENPLTFKGFNVQNKEGVNIAEDVKSFKAGNNIIFSVQNKILTIECENFIKSINNQTPDSTGNVELDIVNNIETGDGISGDGTTENPISLNLDNYTTSNISIHVTNSFAFETGDISFEVDGSNFKIVIPDNKIYLNNHLPNSAGGFAIVDISTGKLPSSIIPGNTGSDFENSNIKKVVIQRPVSDEELYPILVSSQTEGFTETISIDPSTKSEDREKIKVFDGSVWSDFPAIGGLGTPFDNMEIGFDLSSIEYNQPYFIKYAWKNSDGTLISNWKGSLFPSTTIMPSINKNSSSSEGGDDSSSVGIGTVTSVNYIQPDDQGNVTIPEASISNNGLMTSEDKIKLDGLTQDDRLDIQFTSSDLQEGRYIVENCTVGSCVVIDQVGNMIVAGQQQSGTSVIIDLSTVTITGTWTIAFIRGGGSGITLDYIQEQAVQAAIIFG